MSTASVVDIDDPQSWPAAVADRVAAWSDQQRAKTAYAGDIEFSDTFRSAGLDRAGFRQSRELAAGFARRCHDRHSDVLAYAGMPDVARDMDRIRSALGEARISYFGVSGGAHLGAVYSKLFPGRVDRMVLDSAYSGPSAELRERGPAAEAAFDEWARWTAARDAQYRLGPAVRPPGPPSSVWSGIPREPITIDVGGRVHHIDDNTLPLPLQRWLNHEDDNASLAGAVRELVDATDGRPVTPSTELVERLAFFDAQDPMLDNGLGSRVGELLQ